METKIESTYVRDEKFAKEYFSYHFIIPMITPFLFRPVLVVN